MKKLHTFNDHNEERSSCFISHSNTTPIISLLVEHINSIVELEIYEVQ